MEYAPLDAPAKLYVDLHLVPEAGLDLRGELSSAVLGVQDSARLSCEKPLSYRLHVSLVGHRLLVQGSLSTELRCTCDRCLTAYEQAVSVTTVCHYYEQSEADRIDLTDDLREDIVIDFPVKLLCSAACRGLCPVCGQNLNARDCACSTAPTGADVWQELDRLVSPDSQADPEVPEKNT